ncbi:MAG: hypothetical protein BSOLF_0076 [Candidatus Carbobacillus altaicus]|uniref:Uncharacterized protein n=1 Tax=Candidatus Carbonibacillus altaicus TaxID=2163959 RepID=A0A2R6XXJ8_9BACL|nr:MAG: hypothetical protein BSOLF_0076 [Candidatus Carbobacillus altaicus]
MKAPSDPFPKKPKRTLLAHAQLKAENFPIASLPNPDG